MSIAACHRQRSAAISVRAIVSVGLFLTIVSTATAQYSGGTGEPNDPYQITTAADLIALGETPEDYDKHFILTVDIDLDPNLPGRKVFDKAVIAPSHDTFSGGAMGSPRLSPGFAGVFDGNGHTISHLTIAGIDCLGLFGYLASGAQVKDVGLEDVAMAGSGQYVGGLVGAMPDGGHLTHCHSTGVVTGSWGVGGLVGTNGGWVTQCRSSGIVSGDWDVGGLVGENGLVQIDGWDGYVTACNSSATVRGKNAIGGLVGCNDAGSVVECYSTGPVHGEGGVGGLVGGNGYATVIRCYSTGAADGNDSVGGLVGSTWGGDPLHQCYSTGAVSGTGDFVGGLVGHNWDDSRPWLATAIACFWDTETSGQTTSAAGTGKTTAEMQMESTFTDSGWDFAGEIANGPNDVWKIVEGYTYPLLSWQKYSGGTGEPNDPYQIATAADLITLGETPEDYDKHFIMIGDIDLDPNLPGGKVFDKALIAPDKDTKTRIEFEGSPFTGIFDGKDHTISNLTIQSEVVARRIDYVGLFGCVKGASAEVKNLRLLRPAVSGSSLLAGVLTDGTISNCHIQDCNVLYDGAGMAAGLVIYNHGAITDCHVSGKINGGGHWTGGLAAVNEPDGTITRCSFSGSVQGGCCDATTGGLVADNDGGISFCYSTGCVSGPSPGGLVGSNAGVVDSCYSTSSVSPDGACSGGLVSGNFGIVSYCYSTGRVSGSDPGGLVAWNGGSVACCFWDTQTSGQTASAGGAGLTTIQMQTTSIFLDFGWDFVDETGNGTEDIWWIDEGKDYPRLWWEARD